MLRRALRSKRLALILFGAGAALSIRDNANKWSSDRELAMQLRARPNRHSTETLSGPRVSVLVAAWNEAQTIERHIRSVLQLRYPDLEYVIAAGGGDGTRELAKQFESPNVIVLEQHAGQGKQVSLRQCLQRSGGSILYLTDADCLLDDCSFEAAVGPIVRGEADVVSGDSVPLPEQRLAGGIVAFRWAADAYSFAHLPASAGGILGRNCALSRAAMARAGSLEADVASGTDYHLAKSLLAAGIRIQHAPDSAVATRYPSSIGDYARRQRRWLRNMVLHGLRFGAQREALTSLSTSLVGLGMVIAPLLALLAGPALLALWSTAWLHSALGKARYLAFTHLRYAPGGPSFSWIDALETVPMSLLESAVWALPLLDYLVPRRRSAW